MLWTLDSLRGHSGASASDAETAKKRDPLAVFYGRVDLMIYIAAVGLAACVMVIVMS